MLTADAATIRSRPLLIQLALLPLLYYAGAKLSLAFAVTSESLVVLWVSNGILLAGLFHYGWRRFFGFALMILGAELAADLSTFSAAESLVFGVVNLLEVTIAYVLLKQAGFDPRFATPRDIGVFVIAGPVAAAFASSLAGAAVYHFSGGHQASFFEFQRVWWFSDGLGLLIVTPLALSLWPPLPATTHEPAALRWYDGLVLAAAIAVLGALLLARQELLYGWMVRPFLLIPFVVYAAARFTTRITALLVVALAFAVLYITKAGHQPFGALSIRDTVISAQELIFVMSIIGLGLAGLLSQQRAVTRALESRVEERTAQLRSANAELEQLAATDPLTGLLNRRSLFDLTRRELERARRHGHPLTTILLDVDHFKAVNDRYGHAAGDLVLQAVAEAARLVVRASDTVARYGGEEFVIVAPETDRASGVQLAERLRTTLHTTEVPFQGGVVRVTASFGVATLRAEDREPEDLFRRSDQALYAAKEGGRDRVTTESETDSLTI